MTLITLQHGVIPFTIKCAYGTAWWISEIERWAEVARCVSYQMRIVK